MRLQRGSAHTHTTEFMANDLNQYLRSVPNLEQTSITGDVRCNIWKGDSTSPVARYPDAPANPSIGVWSINQNNNTMAADLLDELAINQLPVFDPDKRLSSSAWRNRVNP